MAPPCEQHESAPQLTLWWQATAPPGRDLTVFVHVLDAAGRLAGQVDSMPDDNASPTSIWQAGDVVRDVRALPAAPAGGTLLIGLYDAATVTRLPATSGGARLADDAYRLDIPR